MSEAQEYARALVWGIALNSRRKSLSADYCGRVLRWIDQVAPEVTRNKEAIASWIAVECKRNGIVLVE